MLRSSRPYEHREHVFSVFAAEGKCKLGIEQSVLHAQIIAVVTHLKGEVFLLPGKLMEGIGECDAARVGGLSETLLEEIHDGRRENVDAKETVVVARAQPWDQDAFAADGAEVRQQALTGGLNSGDGTGFSLSGFHHPLGAALRFSAHVEVISNQMEKRFILDELPSAPDRMAVSQRLRLGHKGETG